jgi:hypothetical protein
MANTDHLSPLDQSLMGRARAKQPYPDAKLVRQQQLRAVAPLLLDYTPGQVKGDSPAARNAAATLSELSSTWATIADAAKESPMEKLAPVARRAYDNLAAKLRTTKESIDTQIAHYATMIEERIAPRIDAALAAEIRSHLRDKDIMAITKAAATDPRVSSALLSAPAILTNLKPDQLALVRKSATKAHAPEQAALMDEAKAAGDRVAAAADYIVTGLGSKIVAWELEAKEPAALQALR